MASMMLRQNYFEPGPMGMPTFGAEGKMLLAKADFLNGRQSYRSLQILAGVLVTLLGFIPAYLVVCTDYRHDAGSMAAHLLALVPALFVALLLVYCGRIRMRRLRSSRAYFACAIGLAIGALWGNVAGNRMWYTYMVRYYAYHDMGNYVNLDPSMDSGGAFMDAGTAYFKDSTFVLVGKALAFKNGRTYCIAPIVREIIEINSPAEATATGQLMTQTHYSLPQSGTVDFWAVGTDCCGATGADVVGTGFTCGAANSPVARSGLRVLDSVERQNYLLAVQEWSADIGLPVRHPLFFEWVVDPVPMVASLGEKAWSELWYQCIYVLLVGLVVQVLLHMYFKWMKVF